MTEHLSTQTIERYHQRRLAPRELIAIEEHFAHCGVCRQKLVEPSRLQSTTASFRADLAAAPEQPDHLDVDWLEAYVNGELDKVDREIAEGHLEFCQQCTDDVFDLRTFAAEVASYPDKEYAPTPSPTFWEKLLAASRLTTLAPKLTQPFHAFPLSLRIAGAVTFAVLVLLAVVRWLPVLKKPSEPPQIVIQTPLPTVSPDTAFPPSKDDTPSGSLDRLDALALADQQKVKTALADQKIKISANLSDLRPTSGVPMGGSQDSQGAPIILESPVGIVVASNHPVFRWRRLSGTTSYRVTILDHYYEEVPGGGETSAAEWRATHPLKHGEVYTWQVKTEVNGKEISSSGKFKVLERARADELERVKKAARDNHLLLGILYADAGALGEAAREFNLVPKTDAQFEIARKLLRDVQAQIRAQKQPAAAPKTRRQ